MSGKPTVAFSKFTAVLALGLLTPTSIDAQQVEDDYYEAFDATAAPLAFRDPPQADVEYYSNRTKRLERRRINPNLVDCH